jgi:hypothetical protein
MARATRVLAPKTTSECKHVLGCAISRGPSWASAVFRCSFGHARINWYALHMGACDQMNQWQLLCRPMPDLPAPLRDGALSETDYRAYSDRMKPHVDKALGMLLDTPIPSIVSPSMMSAAKVVCTSSLFCTVALCVRPHRIFLLRVVLACRSKLAAHGKEAVTGDFKTWNRCR